MSGRPAVERPAHRGERIGHSRLALARLRREGHVVLRVLGSSSIGAGIRLTLPFLGQTPIALDFAFPLSKNSQDDTQIFSFSFGFQQ